MRTRPVLVPQAAPAPTTAVVAPKNLQYLVIAGAVLAVAGVAFVALLLLDVVTPKVAEVGLLPVGMVLVGCGYLASPWLFRATQNQEEVTWLRRLRWVGLAAVPSSLMLGVTTYMTTDIAAVPLFWIVPLALYLLSFILVFARWPVPWTGTPHNILVYAQPLILFAVGMVMFGGLAVSPATTMVAHLTGFFICVMVCHGELARDRPSTRHLTEFYLWMSVGGVLGGMFNALLAPVLFKHVIEYFLMLMVALLLRPRSAIDYFHDLLAVLVLAVAPLVPALRPQARDLRQKRNLGWARQAPEPSEDEIAQEYLLDLGYAICLGLLAFALLRLSRSPSLWPNARNLYVFLYRTYENFGFTSGLEYWALWTELAVIVGIPLVICLCFVSRPLRFGLAVGCFLIAYVFMMSDDSDIVYANRSFFSVQRVRVEESDAQRGVYYHVLLHGGIDHGRQYSYHLDDKGHKVVDKERRDKPISYFFPTNPIGQIFTNLKQLDSNPPYAIVGLGIGTMASYGRPGQVVHFYEIDPKVLELSEPSDGREPYFWYIHDAKERGVKLDVILGDGRLKLKDAPPKFYQVIVLDAFSSDAIPVHLMTKEAIAMYLTKLRDDGILVFNITNRYVRLAPILADLAKEFDLVCLTQADYNEERLAEKFPSDWVIMFPKKKRELQVAEALLMLQGGPGAGGVASVPWAAIPRTPQFDWPDPLTTRLYLNTSGKRRARQWVIAQPSGRPPWTDHFSDLIRAINW
jgi:hypothetical protein